MDAKAERISKSRLDKTRQRRIRHFFLRQCKKAILTDGLLLNLMPFPALRGAGAGDDGGAEITAMKRLKGEV
ncbi:hypothetical protein BEC88_21140 [Escherichia coli]|nr:hypothetical protein [Escherichia coli]